MIYTFGFWWNLKKVKVKVKFKKFNLSFWFLPKQSNLIEDKFCVVKKKDRKFDCDIRDGEIDRYLKIFYYQKIPSFLNSHYFFKHYQKKKTKVVKIPPINWIHKNSIKYLQYHHHLLLLLFLFLLPFFQ